MSLDIMYGLTSLDRDRGNFPKIPVINMFAEQVPTEDKPALQSRPGLAATGSTMGSGPIKTLYQIDGVLGGALFGISGGHLYNGSTDLGAINGTDSVCMAGFEDRVFACAGSDVWVWDGTTLTTITEPGDFDVTAMCVGSDRLIVIDKDTGHFYWSDVLSDNVDALSFATAENSPDELKDILFNGDTLMLFGSETVEFWPASSANPDLPFAPLIGKTFQVGIRDTGCATLFSNTFVWVTNNNQICAGATDNVISTPSLDEKLSDSTTARLWTFRLEGTQFLAVTLDDATWVFSATSSQWSEFQSYGKTNFIPGCYANGIFGSSIDGRLITWSTDHSDFGSILERRIRAGAAITVGTMGLNNFTVRTNPGRTPYMTGDYLDPIIELRVSRDGGFTWGTWKQKTFGEAGSLRKRITWRSLGFFSNPGLMVEIRVTDPVPFRISGISANDDYGNI